MECSEVGFPEEHLSIHDIQELGGTPVRQGEPFDFAFPDLDLIVSWFGNGCSEAIFCKCLIFPNILPTKHHLRRFLSVMRGEPK
jgi:hypothetical protein